MNLHYGCGLVIAPGWYNCDGSPTLWLQRIPMIGAIFRRYVAPRFPMEAHYGNIVRGLQIPEESCDAIYCCHVLEHLSLEDARRALRNTFRYLRPGGLFRIVVPDFEQQVATYLRTEGPEALPEFLSYTHLGRKSRPKGPVMMLREMLGNSHHLWMWDKKALAAEMNAAGFRDVRPCVYDDSRDPAFKAVENPSRFEWALALEGTK